MRDDFSNLRAERDEPARYRDTYSPPPKRQGNLTLQIALGIWLGGVALGITGFIASLLLATFGMTIQLP
ncbi:hypothetical protein IB229_19550 [Pseudomonas sp. PDM14]|uniref:hypothetical protein n=1 Tax=Pseudomonas sp. PDM14 TaxID=2769288 RepID=UPI001780CDD2|nr:hypothetical protein [Pseudomonas sp. PDM14]MBD9485183.1 hypothetical protein [Pseudomonas sp. PDM14]